MTRRFFSIYSLVLILSLCFIQSLHAKANVSAHFSGVWGGEYSYQPELRDPVASLYLHLITRPGVTAESDLTKLVPVVNNAALSFRKSLSQGYAGALEQALFVREVNGLVNAYQRDYTGAPDGIAGAEARGMALDRLLEGLISASERFGIPLEILDMALLNGCSVVERLISQPPLSTSLSETERELVEYLLRFTVHQERRRILLDSTREALTNIKASEEIKTLYDGKIYQVLKPVLSRETIGLETFLADPMNFDDPGKILTAEYNLEAVCDMFALKYGMELSFLAYGIQDSLIASMADRIPGMTPDLLREQLASVSGLSLTSLAAYASVSPSLPIRYSPVSGLADRLAALGDAPPTPPDFSLFTSTYKALFQLNYDIMLSDMITAKEWSLADNNNPDPTRPLSLSDQCAVKALAMKRSAMIKTSIRGVPEQTSRALRMLFQTILIGRI